ncbi:MAG: hypothetical protein ACLUD2_04765 [Clostridium sp.]
MFVRPEKALEKNGTTSGWAVDGMEVRVVDEDGRDVPFEPLVRNGPGDRRFLPDI